MPSQNPNEPEPLLKSELLEVSADADLFADFAIDVSQATPEWWAAIVKAQAQADTIGKGEENRDAHYKYASAENVIEGGRKCLALGELAMISTFTQVRAPSTDDEIGNRFVAATVTMHTVCGHAGGGYVRMIANMDAIGSRRTPHDKAVAACATYMGGFVLLRLLNLARHEEGSSAVDKRDDTSDKAGGYSAPPDRPAASKKTDPLRRAVSDRMAELFRLDLQWTARVVAEGEPAARAALFASLNVPAKGRLSAAHLRTVKDYLDERLAALKQDAEAEAGEEPPHDPETGEVPEPYDAGDGKDLETGEEPSK